MVSSLSLFPETAEVNSHGHLEIGGCDVTGLAAEFGTPLYIFDERHLRKKCRQFKLEFGKRHADSNVLYAGKAFLNRALALLIKEEGLGLDVVSAGELAIAKMANFPMDMVYIHGNNKSADELNGALKHHVGRIVVDNYDELAMLTLLANETGHIPEILLRLTTGVDLRTHTYINTSKIDSKFGFTLFNASKAVAIAMEAPSLNLVGFHFHLGSMINEVQPYQEAIELVLEFAASMSEKHGFELGELDIGGGFGIQYTSSETSPPSIPEFAEAIVSQLVSKCYELELPPPSLTIEPGRSIAGSAGVALYRIGVVKDIPGVRCYVSVDGGMGDNIRPAMYGARYKVVMANKMLQKEEGKVAIAGRFCESGDILVKDAALPKAYAGDLVALANCGAYCLPMASNYNVSPRPAVVMVREGEARLIRRRETIEDLTRCDLE